MIQKAMVVRIKQETLFQVRLLAYMERIRATVRDRQSGHVRRVYTLFFYPCTALSDIEEWKEEMCEGWEERREGLDFLKKLAQDALEQQCEILILENM